MWVAYAQPPVPAYSGNRVTRKSKKDAASSPDPSSQVANDHQNSNAPSQLSASLAELLEPAVEGPPSPERIRALSKQMKSVSAVDRHHSHQTTSSGSSSLRSLASGDRPSWEQAIENITLSRKSSNRSTSSSMPSRERPESVQIFGKTIFNRRAKLKRESSAQSSSASSLYSVDIPPEAAGVPPPASSTREFIPGIFSRRRTMKSEGPGEDSSTRARLQISGPYNFQHVTHAPKDQIASLQRTDRPSIQSDLTALGASRSPAIDPSRGFHASGLHFADFSSEALPLDEDGLTLSPHSEPQFDAVSGHYPMSPSSSQRLVRNTRSQEQLRGAPPRPPRSPLEPSFVPPVPPPRMSSRTSTLYDGFDRLAATSLDRPLTSGGYRRPNPFSPSQETADRPAVSQVQFQGSFFDEQRFSPALTSPPENSNWPFTGPLNHSFETALPDVPEEEENNVLTRQSRASVRSTNSSLRGSQSVPLLRQMSQSQSITRRPPSGESVTLGRLDMYATQRALQQGPLQDGGGTDVLPRDSWEEVIDYCYEHQAEADCDYAWDRPSIDLMREDGSAGTVGLQTDHRRGYSDAPSAMLAPGQFDMPALSPASQVSTTTVHEAPTPTATVLPARSNFSRKEPPPRQQRYLHIRTASHASSFRESHGFDLSPSLLIPGDYHQELLARQADGFAGRDDFAHYARYEEPTVAADTSTLLVQSRSSASTMESKDSAQSASERHISAASTSTDYTGLTVSTASLHMDDFSLKQEQSSIDADFAGPIHSRPTSKEPMPVVLEADRGLEKPLSRSFGRGSDSNLVKKGSEDLSAGRRKEPIHSRRARARTTSLSTPPPAGQYAMFPSISMTGSRI